VRRADGVEIVLLHDQNVAGHPLGAHDVGGVGVVLVPVGSLDQHRDTVDQELSTGDLDLAKTDVG